MKKFFNTAGACQTRLHYFVERPLGLDPVLELIEQEKYFTHHAPRQSGKTSLLRQMCFRLNEEGKYLALHINVESAQAAKNDIMEAIRCVLRSLQSSLKIFAGPKLPEISNFFDSIEGVKNCLEAWSLESSKPIVLVIDEIDSMYGDSLIALLRQLRAGYDNRPHAFPQSVILNGVRDIKDYRIYSQNEDTWMTGGSCFNIKAESVRLGNFTFENVVELFRQHEAEHGQKLQEGVVEDIFELTDGQPWLCNALGEQMCHKLFPKETLLTQKHLKAAKEALILARTTHIDQLYYRLEDPRIRQIVFPMVRGEDISTFPTEDIEYARDLGLLKADSKVVEIANPLYKEVLPREMAYALQHGIAEEPKWYELPGGKLNYPKLMHNFVQFWREHHHREFYAKEVLPHVMFMAWLQKLVNGGGTIHREYALGRRAMDILVEYGEERFVSEIKLWRGPKTLEEGLKQLSGYLAQIGLKSGYLMIFDGDDKKSSEDKIRHEQHEQDGKTIEVWFL